MVGIFFEIFVSFDTKKAFFFIGSIYDENKSTDGADESTASSMGDDLVFNDADKKTGAHKTTKGMSRQYNLSLS